MADPGTAAVLVAALADSASVAAFVARLVAAGRSRWAASRDERVIRAALVEAIATAAVDHVRLGQGAGELSDGRWVTGKLAPLLEVWTGHSSDLGTVLYVAAATQWSRDVDRWTHAAVDAIGDGLKVTTLT